MKVILPIAMACLISLGTFAGGTDGFAIFKGKGVVRRPADFVSISLKIALTGYTDSKYALDKTKEITNILTTTLKKYINNTNENDKIITKFSLNNLDTKTTLITSSIDSFNTQEFFMEIHNAIAGAKDSSNPYRGYYNVEISDAVAGVLEEKRTEMKNEALTLAIQDAQEQYRICIQNCEQLHSVDGIHSPDTPQVCYDDLKFVTEIREETFVMHIDS